MHSNHHLAASLSSRDKSQGGSYLGQYCARWLWEHTISVHVFLEHMVDIMADRMPATYTYGDLNEYAYEQKHCNTKRFAHQFAGNMKRVLENMAVFDLSKYRSKEGRSEIKNHVRRNLKKQHDDRTVRARRAELAKGRASVEQVQACVMRARADFDNAADGGQTGACPASVVAAFKNMWVESDTYDKAPTYPDPAGWRSVYELWTVVGGKERGERQAADAEEAVGVDADGVPLTEGGLAGQVAAAQDDNDADEEDGFTDAGPCGGPDCAQPPTMTGEADSEVVEDSLDEEETQEAVDEQVEAFQAQAQGGSLEEDLSPGELAVLTERAEGLRRVITKPGRYRN